MSSVHAKYEAQNTEQSLSEQDPFTGERYEQFFRRLPAGTRRVLDVGCNTGRGGARLKQLQPALQLAGLDCVRERLDALPDCYAERIYGMTTELPLPDSSFDAAVRVAGSLLQAHASRGRLATLVSSGRSR